MNNVVLVSDEQRRNSAIHIHISILPQTPLPSRLPQNSEQSCVCYAVGPGWLSMNFFLSTKMEFEIMEHSQPRWEEVDWRDWDTCFKPTGQSGRRPRPAPSLQRSTQVSLTREGAEAPRLLFSCQPWGVHPSGAWPLMHWPRCAGPGLSLVFGVNRLLNLDRSSRFSKVKKPAWPSQALRGLTGCSPCACHSLPPSAWVLGRLGGSNPRSSYCGLRRKRQV